MPRPLSAVGVAGARFGPRGEGYWHYRRPDEAFYSQYAADDYAGGFIRFEGDVGLQVESFWASHQPGEVQVELFGTEAGAQLRPLKLYRTVHGAPQDITVELPQGPKPWDHIAAHFIECILDDVPCKAPLRHGLIVQEMMEALLKSAEMGREAQL
jgi:predicted dehydrogenase